MDRVVIEVENLVHIYPRGNVRALKGINLKIYEGDIVSIVGQNGSGKTTLVRHFNGLLRPSSGSIKLMGEETTNKKVNEMSKVCGYVFQNPNHQIFSSKVRDEIEVGPRNMGFSEEEIKQRVEYVSELMNLEHLLDKHPMTLDYTTKKIITIASVLAFNPEILVLDEPTGGLDEIGREMLSKIIRLVHEEGHTVVMISHDMDYVAENSRRVVVMAEGQIQDDDIPEKVFLNKEVLKKAQIEPPQIAQLDMYLSQGNNANSLALSVSKFVNKYKN